MIVRCPRCSDQVTAPANASIDATVRCPLCNDEYPLREALKSVPPLLIVVAPGPGRFTSAIDNGGIEVGAIDKELELELAAADAPKPFVFEQRPAPRRPAARSRPPRREKNPLMEVVKIVAGGVVGLSIGQLLLWWLPGLQVSQRDPIRLAPKLSPYVPWIIPAELRSLEDRPYEDRPYEDVASATPEADRRLANRGGVAADDGNAARAERSTRRPPREEIIDPFATDENERGPGDSLNSKGNRRASSPSILEHREPFTDEPFTDEPYTDEPYDVQTEAGVVSAPVVSANELNAMLAAAQASWEDSTSTEEFGPLRRALCQLARGVTFADTNDPEIEGTAEAARSLLRAVAADEQQLQEILDTPERSPSREKFPGCIVSGLLEETVHVGRLFHSILKTSNGQVTVVSTVDPRGRVHEGERLLILGVAITKPQQQLVGFAGDAEPVIFGGMLVQISHRSAEPAREPAAASETTDPQPERPPAPPEPAADEVASENAASENAAEPGDESEDAEEVEPGGDAPGEDDPQ